MARFLLLLPLPFAFAPSVRSVRKAQSCRPCRLGGPRRAFLGELDFNDDVVRLLLIPLDVDGRLEDRRPFPA